MESIGEKLVGMFESIKQFMIKQDEINHGFDERLKDLEKEIIDLKQALYRVQKEDVEDNN